DAAIETIEEAEQLAAGDARLEPRLHEFAFWRGLAWLRKAELDNCIARHAARCCIWPFEGEGLHRDKAPAERALAAFRDCLTRRPGDPGLRWLATVAAGAADRLDELPDELRVPLPRESEGDAVPRFVDRAPALGVDAFDLCGGAVVTDVDGDGFLDLVSSSFDPEEPMKLFRNRGDGSFEDRSAASGLGSQLGGLNCLAADYDGDGDQDLLVLRGAWLMDRGRIRNSLLRNDGQ